MELMENRKLERIALVSVFNKENLLPTLKNLIANNYTILSSGGTAKFCEQNNIPVIKVQDYTGIPEMLHGRVKTLNYKIFGGILHKNSTDDISEIDKHSISSIDIVIVNCYPFKEVSEDEKSTTSDVIENIDIGGPSLIRAAAKNHSRVTVLVDPNDYEIITTDRYKVEQERVKLAIKAFSYTMDYDSGIYNYFASSKSKLRYGENPNQKAKILNDNELKYEKLGGKELSYNNFLDADTALSCVTELSIPSCVIVKHAAPCGAACSHDAITSYDKAFASDPTSAFGGIIAFNCTIDSDTAKKIVVNQFFEVVLAPQITKEAIEVFTKKKNARIISYDIDSVQRAKQREQKRSTIFGTLMQAPQPSISSEDYTVVSETRPKDSQMEDLNFAWIVAKYVKSNAIVLAKNLQTIGIGNGQTSRIASSEFSIQKAQQSGFSTNGAIMASDGFFPFADNITAAANAGIQAIIQPGGSIRDEEVIDTANKYNLALIHTGVRQFRH